MILKSSQSQYCSPEPKPWLDFPLKICLRRGQVPPSGWGVRGGKEMGDVKGEGSGFGSVTCLCLRSCLLDFTPLNQTPPSPPSPVCAELRPRGLLSMSHRQGVRRSCNWNMDYMNNEPASTASTRKGRSGLWDDNEQKIQIRDTGVIYMWTPAVAFDAVMLSLSLGTGLFLVLSSL